MTPSSPARRLWLLCALLFLAACKDYRRDTITLSGTAYRTQRVDMTATDTFSVIYAIGPEESPSATSSVTIQSAEPSIAAEGTRVDSADGLPYLRLTFRTDRTPSGTYPVKAIVRGENGAFAEVVVTISVINFAELLRRDSVFSNVGDSLDEFPFSSPVSIVTYSTTARPIAGGAPGAFRFSKLGIYPTFSGIFTITNVTVVVDSLTGRIAAPLQTTINAQSFKGTGQLIRTDGFARLRGSFSYDYYSLGGTHYAGRLSL